MTDNVTEEQKIVHKEELYDLVGKPDWKRSYGRPRGRWNDNIKTDL
jgi:hypothetical protein